MHASTVTVACKIPNGMILHTTNAGGEKVTLRLNGARLPVNHKGREIPRFKQAGPLVESGLGGYGLTSGVDADLWAKIESESRTTPPFIGGLIFATPDTASTSDMANDLDRECKSGMEPLDPDKAVKGVEKLKEE